jgi:tight adherence protein B
MSAIPLALGAGIGAGIWLVVRSLLRGAPDTGTRADGEPITLAALRRRFPDAPVRLGAAVVGGILAALLTRWPIAALAGMAVGLFGPDLVSGRGNRQAGTDRTAAIATWTEMLRDTMAAAAGLEQAIITTAPLVPEPIRPEIGALVTRLPRDRLGAALAGLGDDLADPTADLVVSALTLAASGEAQELGELLASLAAAARDSATMRLKVDATRARTRTSVRIITVVTVAMALLLVLLNRSYLAPFDSLTGQIILLGVFACFGGALIWLSSMAHYVAPERFLAGRQPDPPGPRQVPWA